MSAELLPRWQRELEIFRRMNSLLILEGNVLDLYSSPDQDEAVGMGEFLQSFFRKRGYRNILFYNSRTGFSNPYDPESVSACARAAGLPATRLGEYAAFRGAGGAPTLISRLMTQTSEPVLTIMEYASRSIVSPERLDQADVDAFATLLQASQEAAEVRTGVDRLRNLLILLVGKVNDLPAWFYLENPAGKLISVPTPDREMRAALLAGPKIRSFFTTRAWNRESDYYEENPAELDRLRDHFVGLTDGLTYRELLNLRTLSVGEDFAVHDLGSVVDLYKFGIRDNPWNRLDAARLNAAEALFRSRVKGQDAAIGHTMDVLKRAASGLGNLQTGSASKPKGILFFAGPTGTGKTETARTMAEALFGDARCCVRFDMSEYRQSHSDQRLLGAPPGYIGYEAGGQLTNAVRKNPFSILLFDEIEKAHPSILDKFLQILEDGRMTDGRGNTVYFTETVIIFTSNLGFQKREDAFEALPRANPEMDYPTLRRTIRESVSDYFKRELGRPELLNRIGENIVVFDYIRPDTAAAILDAQVQKIADRVLEEKHIRLTLEDEARDALLRAALQNLENGGRGIGNIVERMLLNPLARCLFDRSITADADIRILEIPETDGPVELVLDE